MRTQAGPSRFLPDRSRPAVVPGTGVASPRAVRWVSLALLGLVWVAFTYPMVLGKVHFPTDFGAYFFKVPAPVGHPSNLADTDTYNTLLPWHTYLGNQLHAGHLPLWDPTRFVGVPFAADASTGTFYPPNWLYAFGHVAAVGTAIWAVTILASLLLAYWFLRVLRLHPYAASLGAIVWTFSGFMMAWSTSDPVLGAAVWLPMALGGVELARRGDRGRGAIVAGVALALSALAGQPLVAYFVWLATGLWAVVAMVSAAAEVRRSGRAAHGAHGAQGAPGAAIQELVRGALTMAGTYGIGLGLASIQIFGALEYAGQIAHSTGYATLLAYKIPGTFLKTLLIPDFFGNPVNNNYLFAPVYYTDTAVYAGVLTLPLAVAGVFHGRRRLSLSFGLVALLGLAGAFGAPLLRVVFVELPLLSRFPGTNLMALLLDAGIAGLAALGLDALLRRSPRATRAATVASGVLLAALAALTVFRWGTTVSVVFVLGRGLRQLAVLGTGWWLASLVARSSRRSVLAAGMLVLLVGADLWIFGFSYHPFQPDTPPVASSPELQYLALLPDKRPRFVQTDNEQLPPNFSMVFGLYSINGYDPLVPASVLRLRSLMQQDLPASSQVDNAILPLGDRATEPAVLDLLGVDSVTAPNGKAGPGTLATNDRFSVFDQAGAFPAAFLVPCWSVASDADALRRMQTMSGPDFQATVLVAPGPAVGELGAPPASCPAGPAAVLQRYDAQDVVVSVPAGASITSGGVVVLSDQWYPGWTATLDGRAAPILRVDVSLRGVAVGPGSHTIEFRYQPRWPIHGLAVVALSLSFMGIVATWSTRGPGKPRPPPRPPPRPRPRPGRR